MFSFFFNVYNENVFTFEIEDGRENVQITNKFCLLNTNIPIKIFSEKIMVVIGNITPHSKLG